MQNPFRHQLRFDSSEAWIGALFFINDATGKIVEKGEVTASLPTVNLARRSAGNYYLVVLNKNGQKATLALSLNSLFL